MDLQSLKNTVKEKGAKVLAGLKAWFADAKAKFMAWPRNKKLIVSAVVVLAVAVGVKAIVWPFSKGGAQNPKDAAAQEEYNILFKGKTTATAGMGKSINLGPLKLDFYNIRESSYLSFDKDENQNRITKRYLAAQVHVQNINGEKSESILIGLSDDQGKKYRMDYSVPFYIADMRDFGRNMVMYPRTITEGYIFFSDVDEKAKNLELIIALPSTKERAIFKFERK